MDAARKGALISAAATSIACMGDTILYSVLPVYAEALDLSDLWLGFILSINRFVRLLSHGFVAVLILRIGLRRIVTLSSIFSCLSTFFYQFPHQLTLFAIFRICWGVAYSGLRQSTLMYASFVGSKRKESFALTQFIKSIGPLSILMIGPIIFSYWNFQTSYLMISALSTMAVLLALKLPELPVVQEHFSYLKVVQFSSFKVLLFLISFITDGLLVVVLVLLFQDIHKEQSSLLVVVSLFLLFKRVLSSLLPLLFLRTYQMISVRAHLILGIIITLLGLGLLSQQMNYVGLIFCFAGNSLIETNAPLVELEYNSSATKMEVVTSVTFWWDMGKAFGALLGIEFFKILGSEKVWLVLILLVVLVAVRCFNTSLRSLSL